MEEAANTMDQSNFTSEQIQYIVRCKEATKNFPESADPEKLGLAKEIVENLENGHFVMAVILSEYLDGSKRELDRMRRIFKVKRVS